MDSNLLIDILKESLPAGIVGIVLYIMINNLSHKMELGFKDVRSEMKEGFAKTNAHLEKHDRDIQRLDRDIKQLKKQSKQLLRSQRR